MTALRREFIWKKDIDLPTFLAEIARDGWMNSANETIISGPNELTYVGYKDI